MQNLLEKKCPRCSAEIRELAEERQFKPIGFGRKDKLDPIHRNHYKCGAIVLFDRQNPSGAIEALCCVKVS
jgi:hypothetical protein